MCRAEELRNDLDNLYFSKKFYIGNLAELEDLGQKHTKRYAALKRNVDIINHNIRRIEKELEV